MLWVFLSDIGKCNITQGYVLGRVSGSDLKLGFSISGFKISTLQLRCFTLQPLLKSCQIDAPMHHWVDEEPNEIGN